MKQSVGLRHSFRSWQEERNQVLTANTFANAVGFSPRGRIRLWLEKLGAVEPVSANLATSWNEKEVKAVERYKLITGNAATFQEFQGSSKTNPKDYWLAASPHGLVDKIVSGKSYKGLLEIKCPLDNGAMNKGYPSQIPHYCIPKAQGLMAILDRDWMDFYVWAPKGSSLFRIYRDLEYWSVLKGTLSDFWWSHVQPARDKIYDGRSVLSSQVQAELKSLCPAPKHELCRYLVKESKRVVDNSELLVCEINGKLIEQHRYRVTYPRESVQCYKRTPAELLDVYPTDVIADQKKIMKKKFAPRADMIQNL